MTKEQTDNERLAMLGRLAAGIAHEIRNPLAGIKILIQHLKENAASAPDRQDLAVVEGEIDRIGEIIERFLTFARPAPPDIRRQPVPDIVDEALYLVRHRCGRQGVEVRIVHPKTPCTVPCDRSQIKQVLLNLYLNAIEAMPEGGTLTVTTRCCADGATILVEDTGTGVPDVVLGRLFEPFASARESGTGLGLAISRSIVQAHGGSMELSATGPGGSTFAVRLPGTP